MKRIFNGIIITLFSMQVFAESMIRITVKTEEHSAAGVGYIVEGKKSGTLGKSYTGSGAKNKEYVFGFRKNSIYGSNINCGSMVLTKDTTIVLISKEDKCQSIVIN